MAEKIFPDSKPTTVKPAVATATATNKPQLYNAARPLYRSRPHRSRRSCYCYCYCCLWIIFIILLLTISAAVAGGVLFLLYRPHRPSFSVTSLQITQLNLTSSSKQLTTRFDLTVTARNPNNKNIMFYYDAVSVSIYSKKIAVGHGTIPAFATAKKSPATLKTAVRAQRVEDNGGLKSDLNEKKSLQLTIELDSKVKVKIGGHVSEKAPIRVVCSGIKTVVATAESPATAVISNAKCKVDFRIKIWKWTI